MSKPKPTCSPQDHSLCVLKGHRRSSASTQASVFTHYSCGSYVFFVGFYYLVNNRFCQFIRHTFRLKEKIFSSLCELSPITVSGWSTKVLWWRGSIQALRLGKGIQALGKERKITKHGDKRGFGLKVFLLWFPIKSFGSNECTGFLTLLMNK